MNRVIIAAQIIAGHIAKDTPLEERCKAAFKAARGDDGWPCENADEQFGGAIGAVLLTCNDNEREQVEQSLNVIKALSAAISGVPVNFTHMLLDNENVLPLMAWWHESAQG